MAENKNNIPIGKKRKRKRKNYSFFYLFTIVFLVALAGLSYLVKSYSPDIDVEIGNNESLMLSDSEMEVEMKSVDERLKWIQMEDELPSVAVRNSETKLLIEEDKKPLIPKTEKKIEKGEKKEEKVENVVVETKPPVPTIDDIKKQIPDFRTVPVAAPVKVPQIVPLPQKTVIEQPKSITKVYLGNYATLEEAMNVQNKVSSTSPSLAPFIKAVNDHYIVQLGSFSESDRANSFVAELRQLGYYPKVIVEK